MWTTKQATHARRLFSFEAAARSPLLHARRQVPGRRRAHAHPPAVALALAVGAPAPFFPAGFALFVFAFVETVVAFVEPADFVETIVAFVEPLVAFVETVVGLLPVARLVRVALGARSLVIRSCCPVVTAPADASPFQRRRSATVTA